MPTEELEHELRRVLASAAAGYQRPEQAQLRLLQRNYRPSSSHRRLAAGITAAAAAGSVVLGLGLSGVLGAAPTHSTRATGPQAAGSTGTIRTAAFTITANANGTSTLTLTASQVLDPARLQRALVQHGIPALVKTSTYCSSSPAAPDPASIGVLTVQHGDGSPVPGPAPAVQARASFVPPATVTVIKPAALPSGTELFFDYVNGDHGLFFDLIYTGSYTCSNGQQPPAAP